MWKAFRLLTLDEICHVDREGFVMNSVGKLLFVEETEMNIKARFAL